jgi:hypothetical protein
MKKNGKKKFVESKMNEFCLISKTIKRNNENYGFKRFCSLVYMVCSMLNCDDVNGIFTCTAFKGKCTHQFFAFMFDRSTYEI